MKDRSEEVRRRAASIAAANASAAFRAADSSLPASVAHLDRLKQTLDEAGIMDLLIQYPSIRVRFETESLEMTYSQIGYRIAFDPSWRRLHGLSLQARRGWVRTPAYSDEDILDEVVEHLAQMIAEIDYGR